MSAPDPSKVEIRIRPNTSWFHIDWEGLKNYSDLLWLLVQRDFTARYKQTILGPIWFFLNPLINTIVFTLIFNQLIGVATDGLPPVLFNQTGQLVWTYFATVLGSTANSLAGNTHLFAKVYFPRLIPPLATSISSLLALGIQLVTFVGLYIHHIYTHGTSTVAAPSFQWLWFIGITIHVGVLALGTGLILSALSAKYRDFQHIQGFLINIWMYASPIIYPLSTLKAKYPGLLWLADINPLTAIVEATRHAFLGVGTVSLVSYSISVGISICILLIGLFSYQKSARTFVDTV